MNGRVFLFLDWRLNNICPYQLKLRNAAKKSDARFITEFEKLLTFNFNLTKNFKNCIIFSISLDRVLSATHPTLHPVQTPQKVSLRDYETSPRLTDQINIFGGA